MIIKNTKAIKIKKLFENNEVKDFEDNDDYDEEKNQNKNGKTYVMFHLTG